VWPAIDGDRRDVASRIEASVLQRTSKLVANILFERFERRGEQFRASCSGRPRRRGVRTALCTKIGRAHAAFFSALFRDSPRRFGGLVGEMRLVPADGWGHPLRGQDVLCSIDVPIVCHHTHCTSMTFRHRAWISPSRLRQFGAAHVSNDDALILIDNLSRILMQGIFAPARRSERHDAQRKFLPQSSRNAGTRAARQSPVSAAAGRFDQRVMGRSMPRMGRSMSRMGRSMSSQVPSLGAHLPVHGYCI
jgi:hypothetical protein